MEEVFSSYDEYTYEHTMAFNKNYKNSHVDIILKFILGFMGKYKKNHGYFLREGKQLYYAGAAIIPDTKNPNKIWVTVILSRKHQVRSELLKNPNHEFFKNKKAAKLDVKKYWLLDGYDPRFLNYDYVIPKGVGVELKGGCCTCGTENKNAVTLECDETNPRSYYVGKLKKSSKLACIGGIPSKKIFSESNVKWSNKRVVCHNQIVEKGNEDEKFYSDTIITEDIKTVGAWHGECVCPNGDRVKVGDNKDGCKSLACIGGVQANCSKFNDEEIRGTRAICGRKINLIDNKILDLTTNQVEVDPINVGSMGGLCTCPNGESYMVGDNRDNCRTLACVNGTSGPCQKWKERYRRGIKVVCGKKDEAVD